MSKLQEYAESLHGGNHTDLLSAHDLAPSAVLLVGMAQTLEEILAVLRHMNSAERTGAVSSVKVTLQRGTIDVACHAYTGSDIQEAEQEALASYRRVLAELNQQGADAFAAEVARRTGK